MSRRVPNRKKMLIRWAYNTTDAVKRFVPCNSLTSATVLNAGNYHAIWCPPAAGRVLKVSFYSSVTTMGSTAVGTHINTGAYPSATAGETQTQTVDTAALGYVFEFASSDFAAGDLLAISIDPTGNAGNQHGSLLLELDE